MASNAAAPFWRSAGMTYITYSRLCANLVRQCLKEPYRSEALSREKVHFSVSQFLSGSKANQRNQYLQFVDNSQFSVDGVLSQLFQKQLRCLSVNKNASREIKTLS
ncbi:hypothetical protein OROMI_001361 [Orobanche minor]